MSELINYGCCVGVKDKENNIIIEQHKYNDGKKHLKGSHGLCYDCLLLTYYYNNLTDILSKEESSDLERILRGNNIKQTIIYLV